MCLTQLIIFSLVDKKKINHRLGNQSYLIRFDGQFNWNSMEYQNMVNNAFVKFVKKNLTIRCSKLTLRALKVVNTYFLKKMLNIPLIKLMLIYI